MTKISELADVVFDGVNNPYVPPKQLKISPKLKLHRDAAEDIDPVTFEVIRHNLWNINEEHGATIQRISGSPVAMYALDLNPSILTEDAEFIFFGPYMQYMSGVTDTQVKWILENRSDNPEIREGNTIRRDIEDIYLRSSRKPELVALDFRAQMAGNMAARERVLQLIRRYGARTVKGVMKRILSNGETAFLQKLARLPDGTWRDRTYVECCRPGDRGTYRVMCTLTKRGDTLIFENEGTAPQQGAMNATYSGWRGAIMVALNQLLCWEQYFSVGGALRHIEFEPPN